MAFQCIFKDDDGRNIASPVIDEQNRKTYLEMLDNNNISYEILEREEKRWHCTRVVFDIQLIEAARKAIKEGKDMYGLYTFGDPDEIAKKDKIVEVQCTDGRLKNAYVVDIWLATADEIKAFKDRIKYPKLGIVKKNI